MTSPSAQRGEENFSSLSDSIHCTNGVFAQTDDLVFISDGGGRCLWSSKQAACAFSRSVTPMPNDQDQCTFYESRTVDGKLVGFLVTLSRLPNACGGPGSLIGVAHPLLTKSQERLYRLKSLAPWITTVILSVAVLGNWVMDIYFHFVKR